ncbi:MAG: 16S rRNA (adenine(1518)-N(6)/adenine(1519)-N(6))-dimethyltransferase [Micrococcales bacterium 73-13]|nr:MAG: 16S rRNA (adenine(1518)-N(6)/adenine(1519)-N(6))-dimethyltransferase [Micrococcales bacterium 73-13]
MVRLLGPAEVRELAQRLDLSPTKRLGQNFVIDANTVRRIVATADVVPGERVIEIGPGLGSLTLGLVEAGASVTAVEIDRRLAALLPTTAAAMGAPDGSLDVLAADAMTVTPASGAGAGEATALVANLPYNVSVPVLLHVLERFPGVERGLVMVQAEVGQRLAAAPGSKVYGAPSVKAAWFADVRLAGAVGRQVFWPVPNVDSVLVRLDRHPPPGDERERLATFELVDAAFGQRRKMLRQSLAAVLGPSASAKMERAGVDPTARGEVLGVEEFLAIARQRSE